MGSDVADSLRQDRLQGGGFEPNRLLLWQQPVSTWVWTLEPTPAGGPVSSLDSGYASTGSPRAISVFSLLLNEFGDFPMMRRMLLGIKARAESPKRGS